MAQIESLAYARASLMYVFKGGFEIGAQSQDRLRRRTHFRIASTSQRQTAIRKVEGMGRQPSTRSRTQAAGGLNQETLDQTESISLRPRVHQVDDDILLHNRRKQCDNNRVGERRQVGAIGQWTCLFSNNGRERQWMTTSVVSTWLFRSPDFTRISSLRTAGLVRRDMRSAATLARTLARIGTFR